MRVFKIGALIIATPFYLAGMTIAATGIGIAITSGRIAFGKEFPKEFWKRIGDNIDKQFGE